MDAQQAFGRALRARDEGRLAEAEGLLKLGLTFAPSNAMAWSQLGYVQQDLGEPEAAIASFRQAIQLQAELAQAHSGLGWSLLHTEAHTEAIQAFQRSVALVPSVHNVVGLGIAQFRHHRIDDAESSFRQALCLDPDCDEALYFLAMILHSDRGRSDEAISLLRRAIQVDPEYALAHRELGAILSRRRKHREAEQMLRRSLELQDKDMWTHLELGNTLLALKQEPEAEHQYKRACDVAPNASTPYWTLGQLYQNRGRAEDAETLFRKAVGNEPDDPIAAFRLARCLAERGDSVQARYWLTKCLQMEPELEMAAAAQRMLEHLT